MNPLELMRQAKDIQDRMQQQMAATRAQGSAGGGVVTAVVNGAKQLESITLDPAAVSADDVEMLQDLIVAAVNDAQRKVDEQLGRSLSGLMGGFKIPGLG
jgi:hypothetical protein